VDDDNVIPFLGRVGAHPIPSDEELVSFLKDMRTADAEELKQLLEELKITDNDSVDEPEVFTYARLINYLGNGIDTTQLMHIAAAAVWQVYGQEDNET
jgi:hypothetical protein